MGALRDRMVREMSLREFSASTQRLYLATLTDLARTQERHLAWSRAMRWPRCFGCTAMPIARPIAYPHGRSASCTRSRPVARPPVADISSAAPTAASNVPPTTPALWGVFPNGEWSGEDWSWSGVVAGIESRQLTIRVGALLLR